MYSIECRINTHIVTLTYHLNKKSARNNIITIYNGQTTMTAPPPPPPSIGSAEQHIRIIYIDMYCNPCSNKERTSF